MICRLDAPASEAYHSVRLVVPDFLVLIMSVITFVVLRRVLKPVPLTRQSSRGPELAEQKSRKPGVIHKYVETAGELTIVVLLG